MVKRELETVPYDGEDVFAVREGETTYLIDPTAPTNTVTNFKSSQSAVIPKHLLKVVSIDTKNGVARVKRITRGTHGDQRRLFDHVVSVFIDRGTGLYSLVSLMGVGGDGVKREYQGRVGVRQSLQNIVKRSSQ